jgi:hypothetical protein
MHGNVIYLSGKELGFSGKLPYSLQEKTQFKESRGHCKEQL